MTPYEVHRDRTIVYSCKYPVVFCPKYRRKVQVSALDSRLKGLILEKQRESGYTVAMIAMPDPVHLLLDVDPRLGINGVVRKIQGYIAHAIRKEDAWMKIRLPSWWTRWMNQEASSL